MAGALIVGPEDKRAALRPDTGVDGPREAPGVEVYSGGPPVNDGDHRVGAVLVVVERVVEDAGYRHALRAFPRDDLRARDVALLQEVVKRRPFGGVADLPAAVGAHQVAGQRIGAGGVEEQRLAIRPDGE